jgi:hypothetical protein
MPCKHIFTGVLCHSMVNSASSATKQESCSRPRFAFTSKGRLFLDINARHRRGTRHISFNGSESLYTRIFPVKRVPGAWFRHRACYALDPMEKRKSSPDSAGNDANKQVESLTSVLRERCRNQVASHEANSALASNSPKFAIKMSTPGESRSRTSPHPSLARKASTAAQHHL